MNDDERKPRFHINIGALIIIIVIIVLVFKSDIAVIFKSPDFESKVSNFEKNTLVFFETKVINPIKVKVSEFFITTTNNELQKIQDNFSDNILKIPTEGDIENASDLNGEPL